ncbi:3-ketoacyl-ACP reductase [Balneolales bacterium ANBcel1]|nr:3-ketoacyl-ACP reductase [Balneolales bacterium ANBcel1]
MTEDLMKPVALITGGSRGIGKAIARKLGENGFDLAVNGVRDEEQASDALEELRQTGARVLYCQGDVGSREGRDAILARLRESFGRLNVLVNNAGVAPKERLDPLEATEESFERVMRINLQGPYFLTQVIAGWMVGQKKQQEGYEAKIINVGSISATVVSTMRGEYCISKAGFAMHSKIWAVRLAEYGIPVYEVRPGVIRTDMTSGVTDKYDRLIADGLTVQPRWGMPEDVAKAVLSLSRGDFPYSTGEVLMVDGGLTVQRL